MRPAGEVPGLSILMERAGLNDEDLGHRVGKTARAVQSWRLGDATPRSADLMIIAQALNASVDDLFHVA